MTSTMYKSKAGERNFPPDMLDYPVSKFAFPVKYVELCKQYHRVEFAYDTNLM
jgi:hypothetical protein